MLWWRSAPARDPVNQQGVRDADSSAGGAIATMYGASPMSRSQAGLCASTFPYAVCTARTRPTQVTFAEQVPGLTVRYQRRTPPLQRLVEDIGVVLAGRGGPRKLRILNIRLSRCTALSQLMRVPFPPLVVPRAPGMDDFAQYGDTSGTLLVDATTRLPRTLWEGRDAERLGWWLRCAPRCRGRLPRRSTSTPPRSE